MLSSITMLVAYVILALPAAIIGLPWTLLTRDIGFLYRWSIWIVGVGLRIGGIRAIATGQENIPRDRACIFMSNHISNLDPPILITLLPFRSAFFLKRSLLKIPLLGFGMRLANFVPVDRDGQRDSARRSVRYATEVLASGVNIMTFPEGTRSQSGQLLPFKQGPFYLAVESGAPLIPISTWGTQQMMPKGTLRITPGTARIVFHRPLYAADFPSRQALMEAAREAILSGLPPSSPAATSPADADGAPSTPIV
jgi:1-acyl-sn-glycerol-3-phosphate acyltransferase